MREPANRRLPVGWFLLLRRLFGLWPRPAPNSQPDRPYRLTLSILPHAFRFYMVLGCSIGDAALVVLRVLARLVLG